MLTYDPKSKRYRDSRGRFISPKKVRGEIDKLQDGFRIKAKKLSERLNAGKIDLDKWQSEMKSLVKSSHIVASSVGRGGWREMTKSDWGKVGNEIKKQYKFLDRFKRQLDSLSPQVVANRSTYYAASILKTYYQGVTAAHDGGRVKRELNARESCDECEAIAGEWMPVDEMPEIGSLECGSFCKCDLIFEE